MRPVGRFLTDVCTECCVSEENEQLLVSTPVNQLSEEWINNRQLAENLLPLVEKYYFENTQLIEEMRYHWDLFYTFLDGNKK